MTRTVPPLHFREENGKFICNFFFSARGMVDSLDFTGETAEEAGKKAVAYWVTEVWGKGYTPTPRPAHAQHRPEEPESDDIEGDDAGAIAEAMTTVKSGRGQAVAGKIWVFNRRLDDRKRIDPAELPDYEARGYARGRG